VGTDRDTGSQRLFNRRAHCGCIAGMSAARNVGRCDRPHQRGLRAVGDRLRNLAHIAIQIDL
jgi:hypothetical protein